MTRLDSATKLCGVIGHPIGHSLSPQLHNAAYEALGLNYVYLAFDVEDLAGCLAGMRAMKSIRGLSVTIPHKMDIIPLLDRVDALAGHVGSVNTVYREGPDLVGTTTDGPGTLRAFEQAGIEVEGKRVLFVGAGGAVRAVAHAFAAQSRAKSLCITARNMKRANELADSVSPETKADVSAADMQNDLRTAVCDADIIVQGTPIGMHGNAEGQSPIPADFLRPDHTVFDMVYQPTKTRLIQDAEAVGAKTLHGIEMLVHQAALQFERWTGEEAPLDAMRAAADRELR